MEPNRADLAATEGDAVMLDFFSKLLDPDGFVPRWHCGQWSALHGFCTIASDIILCLTSFGIAISLIYLAIRRRDLHRVSFLLWFSFFMVCCGITHATDVVIFYSPLYRLDTVVRVAAAAFSFVAASRLLPVMHYLLRVANPEKVNTELTGRKQLEQELRNLNRDLHQQLLYRGVLEREVSIMRSWQAVRNQDATAKALGELDSICAELRGMMPTQYQQLPLSARETLQEADRKPDDDTAEIKPESA